MGVQVETLKSVLDYATQKKPQAVRPTYDDQPGHLVWISALIANEIKELKPSPEIRLDTILEPIEDKVPVQDVCILNNVNTLTEWENYTSHQSVTT